MGVTEDLNVKLELIVEGTGIAQADAELLLAKATAIAEEHGERRDGGDAVRQRDDPSQLRDRGYGGYWPSIRRSFLDAHPYCSCGSRATEVDHVLAIRDGGTHDAANLRALCKPCHSSRTARDHGFGRGSPLSVLR
jgi:5-methylcytosine-specific restriction protein A